MGPRPPFRRSVAKQQRQDAPEPHGTPQDQSAAYAWPRPSPSGSSPSQQQQWAARPRPSSTQAPPAASSPTPSEPAGQARPTYDHVRLRVDALAVVRPGLPPLRDVSLRVQAGDIACAIGPSEGGTRSLELAALGQVRSTAGAVTVSRTLHRPEPSDWSVSDWWSEMCAEHPALRWLNSGPWRGSDARQRVGYVPRRDRCAWSYPLSVHDVVLATRRAQGPWWRRPRRDDYLAAAVALRRVEMMDYSTRQLSTLTPLQQTLSLLAAALSHHPAVTVLTHPTRGLDAASRDRLGQVLQRLADQGEAFLVVSDDVAWCLNHATTAAVVGSSSAGQSEPSQLTDLTAWAHTFGVGMESDVIAVVRSLVHGQSRAREDDLPRTDTEDAQTQQAPITPPPRSLGSTPPASSDPWMASIDTQSAQAPHQEGRS